jgi:hypothetical protein
MSWCLVKAQGQLHLLPLYDFITNVFRRQAEVIQNPDNASGRITGKGEAVQITYKRLKLGGGQAYDRSGD